MPQTNRSGPQQDLVLRQGTCRPEGRRYTVHSNPEHYTSSHRSRSQFMIRGAFSNPTLVGVHNWLLFFLPPERSLPPLWFRAVAAHFLHRTINS